MVMRQLRAERQAKAEAANAIPFNEAATDAALDNARADLQRAQNELAVLDEQWAEVLVRRSLGEPVDSKSVIHIEERRAVVTQDVNRAAALVQRLEQRHGQADRERRAAIHRDHMARLQEITARAPELERQYMQAATALVEAARALNEARDEHASLWTYANAYASEHGTERPPHSGPYMPFPIPEAFVRQARPYPDWPTWLRGYAAERHFGEDR